MEKLTPAHENEILPGELSGDWRDRNREESRARATDDPGLVVSSRHDAPSIGVERNEWAGRRGERETGASPHGSKPDVLLGRDG